MRDSCFLSALVHSQNILVKKTQTKHPVPVAWWSPLYQRFFPRVCLSTRVRGRASFSNPPPICKMNAPTTHAPPSIKEERREAIRRRQDRIPFAARSGYALPRDLKKVFDEAKGGSK